MYVFLFSHKLNQGPQGPGAVISVKLDITAPVQAQEVLRLCDFVYIKVQNSLLVPPALGHHPVAEISISLSGLKT